MPDTKLSTEDREGHKIGMAPGLLQREIELGR